MVHPYPSYNSIGMIKGKWHREIISPMPLRIIVVDTTLVANITIKYDMRKLSILKHLKHSNDTFIIQVEKVP